MSTTTISIDPRLKPGAYVTDGRRLWEVCVVYGPTAFDRVECENSSDGTRRSWVAHQLKAHMKLVRAAPEVPDQP